MNLKIPMFVIAALFVGFSTHCYGEDENLLKNTDFSEKKQNGIITSWGMTSGASVTGDGVLKIPLTEETRRKTIFCARLLQKIRKIDPGSYEFSGYYKGEIENLFIVVRVYDASGKKKDIITKYLMKKDFHRASDKPGWRRFSFSGTVPEGTVGVSVHIEAFGKKGSVVEYSGIALNPAYE